MSFFLCIFAADLATAKVSKGNAVKVGDSPAAVTLKSEVPPTSHATVSPAAREGWKPRETSQKTCQIKTN